MEKKNTELQETMDRIINKGILKHYGFAQMNMLSKLNLEDGQGKIILEECMNTPPIELMHNLLNSNICLEKRHIIRNNTIIKEFRITNTDDRATRLLTSFNW